MKITKVINSHGWRFPAVLLIFALLATVAVIAADSPSEANDKRIRRLREEIARLESDIASAKKSETSLQQRVSDLDKKIALKKKLSLELDGILQRNKRQLRQKEQRTNELSQQLNYSTQRTESVQKRLVQLRDIARAQAIQRYKHNRRPLWMYILAGENLSDVLHRIHQYTFLQRAERRVTAELAAETSVNLAAEEELSGLHEKSSLALAASRNQFKLTQREQMEADAQQRLLARERDQKTSQLAELHENKTSMERELKERQAALSEIQRLITKDIAERERRRQEIPERESRARRQGETQPERPTPTGVATRGELSWPLRGDVVTRFGWQRGGAYGTTTESPGIEISAAPGTPILAAADGVVAEVTWLRGFGTTVILEHVNGTYTVYAHLGNSSVAQGARVTRGQTLGAVAEVNSEESTLHFEVWNNGRKQDPMTWLERR